MASPTGPHLSASPRESPELMLLLGPNGVGKTTIGQMLEQQYHCKFVGIEQFFMSRYPNPKDLADDMQGAVAEFRKHLLQMVQDSRHPVIFEETGVNPFLLSLIQQLSTECSMVTIHIQASETICQERVVRRGSAANYAKNPKFVAEKRAEFFAQVIPVLAIDAEFRNDRKLGTDLQDPFSQYLHRRPSSA